MLVSGWLFLLGGDPDAVERPTVSTAEVIALAADVDGLMLTLVDIGPEESKPGQSQIRDVDDKGSGGGGADCGKPAVPPKSTDTPTSAFFLCVFASTT